MQCEVTDGMTQLSLKEIICYIQKNLEKSQLSTYTH